MKDKNQKIKAALHRLFLDNQDASLKEQAFRDMLVDQIINIYGQFPDSNRLGATVMTEAASMYDPKVGKTPQKPKNV